MHSFAEIYLQRFCNLNAYKSIHLCLISVENAFNHLHELVNRMAQRTTALVDDQAHSHIFMYSNHFRFSIVTFSLSLKIKVNWKRKKKWRIPKWNEEIISFVELRARILVTVIVHISEEERKKNESRSVFLVLAQKIDALQLNKRTKSRLNDV